MDDLAGFLRTRRSRVDPAVVGIPTDRRRRVEGLRREEVAHLSGVSVDYYVRLEQGRATQPSEQVLDALARVLGLDETERGHLHRLARQRRRRAKAPGGRVRPELARVLDLVADAPALIMGHRLDVLAGNRLAGLLYGRPIPGLNTARHIFLEEAERGLYADWENCTLDVVGHLRLAAGKYPEDPRLASLIGELAMGSERFRRLWARADVRARTHGRKAYRHPLVGLLELHQENFALPDESGMELVVLSAAPDSPAEDGLRLLAGLGADSGDAHPTANAQVRAHLTDTFTTEAGRHAELAVIPELFDAVDHGAGNDLAGLLRTRAAHLFDRPVPGQDKPGRTRPGH